MECAYKGCHANGTRKVRVPGPSDQSVYVCVEHKLLLENVMREQAKGGEKKPCALEGCGKPCVAKGVCGVHYQRWYGRNWLNKVAFVSPEMAAELEQRYVAECDAKAAQATAEEPKSKREAGAQPKGEKPPVSPLRSEREAEYVKRLERRIVELEAELSSDGKEIITADAALDKAGVPSVPTTGPARSLTLAERITLLAQRVEDSASVVATADKAALESVANIVKSALPHDVPYMPIPDLLRLLIQDRDEASKQREALRVSVDQFVRDLSAAKARLETEIGHNEAEHQERIRPHVALSALADAVGYKLPDRPDMAAWTPKALEDLCLHAFHTGAATTPAQETAPLAPDSMLVTMLSTPDVRSTMVEALVSAYRAKVECLDPAALAVVLTGPASQPR